MAVKAAVSEHGMKDNVRKNLDSSVVIEGRPKPYVEGLGEEF